MPSQPEPLPAEELVAVPLNKAERLVCRLSRLDPARKWYVWIGVEQSREPNRTAGASSFLGLYQRSFGQALLSLLDGTDLCDVANSLMTRICESQKQIAFLFTVRLPAEASEERQRFFEEVVKTFMAL